MMRHLPTTGKPYVVPRDDAPDSTFVECYRWDISREPRLLAGLRRDDGTLYLPQPERPNRMRKHIFTHTIQPENDQQTDSQEPIL